MFIGNNDSKWIHHLEAAKVCLIFAMGFDSVRQYMDYKSGSSFYHKPNNYSRRAASCLRHVLPYSIQRIGDEGNVIILNREYKPIGYSGLSGNESFSNGGEWVDYDLFDSAICPESNPRMQSFLKACGEDSAGRSWVWFTFDDLSAPWSGRKYADQLIDIIDSALLYRHEA